MRFDQKPFFRFPLADLGFLQFFPEVIGEAFTITVTAFAISFAVAKILADTHSYNVDANQVGHLCHIILSSFRVFIQYTTYYKCPSCAPLLTTWQTLTTTA